MTTLVNKIKFNLLNELNKGAEIFYIFC